MRAALIAAVMGVSLGGCAGSDDNQPAPAAGSADLQGTVRFVDLEGGCWLIETADERIQPLDLPRELMVDGLEVTFAARDAPGVLTACQAGTPKYVESVRRR